MADLTMLEAAKHHQDAIERTVAKTIVEASPILEYCPVKIIKGAAYRYHREATLGGIAFRGIGGTYTADSGVINPEFEPLVIMGGEVSIDNFEVDVMGDLLDLKGSKYRMKARQAGITFSEYFFEGDTIVDEFCFNGLRPRLVGNQLVKAHATAGAALSLAMLDELLDSVIGENSQKVLFMSPNMRRDLTALVRATTGSSMISFTQDAFGRQQIAYATCPIRVIVREDDGSSFFLYDETCGTETESASVYCVRFGSDYVHAISNKSLPGVKDFGETEAAPKHLGRIEWYPGLVVKHPRAAARLTGVTAAVPA